MSPAAPVIFWRRVHGRNESYCHAECCRRDHDRQRLFSGSRMGHLYFCPALSSRIVRHWRQAGNQRMPWTDLHFFLRDLCLSSACVSTFFSVLGRCFYLFSHHTGHYVPHRRSYKKACAATLGTLAGVVLAGLSAWCFSKASGISGTMYLISRHL